MLGNFSCLCHRLLTFFKLTFSQKNSGTPSMCQTVWILSVLIGVQTVCKDYQQATKITSIMCGSRNFCQGGPGQTARKQPHGRSFFFFFLVLSLFYSLQGGGGGWGPMVLLQRKLLSQGFRRGLQHFPREGGGVRIPYPPSGSAHGYRGKS